MTGIDTKLQPVFSKIVYINASAPVVWHLLTDTTAMKQWMPDAVTDIITDWEVGSPFIIRGQLYKKPFENTGVVLLYHPYQLLEYTHLSSLSRLPDVPESYCKMSFGFEQLGNITNLTLTITNFPTETIYSHLAFYWNVTLELLKKLAETREQ